MNPYFDQVTEAIAVGRRLDAFPDRWSRLCVRKWEQGIRDPLLGDTILSRVHLRQAKIKSGETVPFRRARFPNGDVPLGRDLAVSWHLNGEIWLPKYFFGTPWLVVARTGHGKSVLLANMALALEKTGLRTWQLSAAKTDLLGQLPRFQEEGRQLAVVRTEDLKLNPLQAGRNEPHTHLMSVTSRLAQHLDDLPPRADLLLRAACHEIYREFGVFNGRNDRSPHLFHVFERICTTPGLNVPARDALLDRLGSLLERLTPRCSAWLKGWDPIDLAGYSILFLIWRAGADVQGFVLESLLDHVFQHQVERGVVNGELELFIFVDDAQLLVSSNGSSAMSGLAEKVGKIRGGGISAGFFPQTLCGVSPHLLGNMNGLVMGGTVENDTRMMLGRKLGLSDAQIDWGRLSLQRGQFIGVIAEGDWHEPFAFESKNLSLAHNVTEEEILESQQPLVALPVIFDEAFRKWERHPLIELQARSASPALSPAETRLRNLVVAEPGKPAGHYTRKLGMNGKVARLARERLVQLGLLREHKAQLNRRGKSAIVLIPVGAAADLTTTPPQAT